MVPFFLQQNQIVMTGWKIDFENNVIYVPTSMLDTEMLKMLNDLIANPKGLTKGPGIRWNIVNITN